MRLGERALRQQLARDGLPWLPKYDSMTIQQVVKFVQLLRELHDLREANVEPDSVGPFAQGCGGGRWVIRKGSERS